ncbi:MAG: lipocalin family protein [Thermodesulfovibrionales bacterium]
MCFNNFRKMIINKIKRRKTCSVIICLFLSLWMPVPVSGQDYRDILPGQKAGLPEDLYYRSGYRVQWWYFTGHLFDEKGNEFGYEITFFSAGVQKKKYRSTFGLNTIYISHFAISDIARNRFFYSEDSDRGAFGFAGAEDSKLRVWVGDDILEGTPEKMHIHAEDGDRWIDLWLIPQKNFALNGVDGYSRKSEESSRIASLYISGTSMKTTGMLHTENITFKVTGKSWFDREISSRELGKAYEGWDWFALQLDDNREVMLYRIRKKDGSIDPFSSGTIVYADGTTKILSKDEYTVTALNHWRSKRTGAKYPSLWDIEIPSEHLRLRVKPQIDDQELIVTSTTLNTYWEGTCTVTGTVSGRAYIEMTGYERDK